MHVANPNPLCGAQLKETATKSHKWGEPEHLSGSHCPVSSPSDPNLADGAQGSSTHVEQGEA